MACQHERDDVDGGSHWQVEAGMERETNGDAVLCCEGGVRHSYSVEKASNELAQMIMSSIQLAIIWSCY